MPAVAVCTVDTITTGHDCDGTAGILGSLQTKVKIGGKAVAVQGDAIAPHTILSGDSCVPHSSVINKGSSKVTIAGIRVARVGDSADAGSVASGSGKVSCGGASVDGTEEDT
jgi:uncharacterized Zn-binding protein involved in type VI secretion